MKLSTLAALAAAPVTAGVLLFTPAAFAQTAPAVPGPLTAACLTAQGVTTVKAEAAVKAALALGAATDNITPARQADIDKQVAVVATLRTKLDAALAVLDGSPSVANLMAAQKVGSDLTVAYATLVGLPGVSGLGAAKDDAGKAQTALSAALTAQAKACGQDGPPRTTTPTTPPVAPTTTVAATPTAAAPTTAATPPVDVVTVAPSGGVETGYGPE